MPQSPRPPALLVVLVAVVACREPDPHDKGPGGDGKTTTPTGPTSDTTGLTTTPPTGDTGPELLVYDCDDVPLGVGAVQTAEGAKGYHDVIFTADGFILGASVFGDLLKVDIDGNVQVFIPNAGTIEQMTWLPDGDLAVASDEKGIVRVNAMGAATILNSDIRPYGLITGPDGNLYAANQAQVYRVDPDTGESTVLVPAGALASGSPRVINFDLTYTHLLIGTLSGSQGRVYSVEIDENLDPVGLPEVLASGVGTGGYHDTLGVDICGYVYVADYDTSALYRITPDGNTVQTLLNEGFIQRNYAHGGDWGSGIGGWNDHALYLSQPYHNNQVAEVVVGVPSREWKLGTAINLP